MERRVLIAIVLSFLVVYGYQALFVKPEPKTATAGQTTAGQTAGAAGASTGTAAPAVPISPAASAPATADSAASAGDVVTGESTERDVRVETQRVIAVFTNRGARLKSWRLKDYLDQKGEPLELVASDVAPNMVLPFTLQVEDETLTRALDAALYTVSGAPPSGPIGGETTVTFQYATATGVQAAKSFTLAPTGYELGFNASVTAGGRPLVPTILWGPGLGDVDSGSGRYAVKPRGFYSVADSVTRLAGTDIAKQAAHAGDFQFVGIDDHYFMTAALRTGNAGVTYQHITLPPPANSKDPARELVSYTLKPAAAGPVKFYIGPKDFDQLLAVGREMTRAVDFGRFSWVVVPLLRALNYIYNYVGNYGWSIIILTVLINAVMFPLRHKSVVSMRKMQEIQPEAKAIQDRYARYKATDPEKQKMNQELMALYKERGVNPASGCVPMLLTFPVLFAFYALLTTAIELRGAPFFGWIHDLSLPDPYYVTPILMGITQVWQARITPQAGADPAQQKMMMFMPVVMMAFFLWAPAGVALYWFISNIWGIGQQYLTTYLIGPPNIRTPRPAAERRVKRVGGGKTEAASRES